MKQLSIIVRKEKLVDVKNVLFEYNSGGMTVYDVMGCGHYRELDSEGVSYVPKSDPHINLTSKVRIDTVVNDDKVEMLMDKICDVASTGKCGDGKIFVTNVEDAIRIRNRERGTEAI